MKSDDSAPRTRPFENADARSDFRCGKHSLDDYFHQHAANNNALGVGRTFVLTRDTGATDLPEVLGYFTLSMATVLANDVREQLPAKLPRYPLPVALIGRLAVDERARGRRLGEALLLDAMERIAEASTMLGCVGVIVDALDADAETFYAAYDFEPIGDAGWPRRMFLAMASIREALSTNSEDESAG